MKSSSRIQSEVVESIQECLKELGFEPQVRLSTHEGLVHARKEIEGECIRVVAHITDREVKTATNGPLNFDVSRARVAQMVVRPTLAAQTSTRYAPEQDGSKECD